MEKCLKMKELIEKLNKASDAYYLYDNPVIEKECKEVLY
jgi:hypothetical protein